MIQAVTGEDFAARLERTLLRPIGMRDSAFATRLEGPLASKAEAVSDNEAILSGIGRGKGETIRVIEKDGAEHVAYSGYLLRKKAPQPASQ